MSKQAFVEEYVFLLLGRCSSHAKKIMEKQFRALGITVSEYAFLRMVENHPHSTAADVRKRLLVSAPSAAQQVRILLSKGLLARLQDEKDIRRQRLLLTKSGVTVIGKARNIIQELLMSLGISDSSLHSLYDNLSLLSSSLFSYGK